MGHDRPLAAHEVQLWAASLEPERHEAARRLAATTDAERERASRFLRPDGAERYLSAHGALRLILADYLMCDPVALRFGAHENGKPFLEGARLEFNLSHSATLALIAVARDRRVGVDVEQVRPMTDVDEVAARVCTPEELATLAGIAKSHRERAFFAMWTRKEALAKATGEGIGGIFRRGESRCSALQDRWTVMELSDLPGYAACVVAEGIGFRLVRRAR